MKVSIVLFTLMMAAATPANAGGLQFRDFEVRGDQNVWTYSVTSRKSSSKLTVVLKIPRSAYVKLVRAKTVNPVKPQEIVTKTTVTDTVRQDKTTSSDTPNNGKVTIRITDSEKRETVVTGTKTPPDNKETTPEMRVLMEQTWTKHGTLKLVFERRGASNPIFVFEVIARTSVTRNGEIEWTICPNGNENACTGNIPGPVGVGDPWVRYVFSGGISFCRNSDIDYVLTNNAVVMEDSAKITKSFSAGLALNLLNYNNKLAADLLLSFEFGVDGAKIIDGYIWGITFRFPQHPRHKIPEVFAGVSFRTHQDLRLKSLTAAKELTTDPNGNAICKNPTAVPIHVQGKKKPICHGTPLIEKTNRGFVAGFVFPINIGNWVAGRIKKRLGG